MSVRNINLDEDDDLPPEEPLTEPPPVTTWPRQHQLAFAATMLQMVDGLEKRRLKPNDEKVQEELKEAEETEASESVKQASTMQAASKEHSHDAQLSLVADVRFIFAISEKNSRPMRVRDRNFLTLNKHAPYLALNGDARSKIGRLDTTISFQSFFSSWKRNTAPMSISAAIDSAKRKGGLQFHCLIIRERDKAPEMVFRLSKDARFFAVISLDSGQEDLPFLLRKAKQADRAAQQDADNPDKEIDPKQDMEERLAVLNKPVRGYEVGGAYDLIDKKVQSETWPLCISGCEMIAFEAGIRGEVRTAAVRPVYYYFAMCQCHWQDDAIEMYKKATSLDS